MTLNQQDAVLALGHWVEMSHKLNPPDGSGQYYPLMDFVFMSHYGGKQVAEFLKNLEQDQDPVIRICARAGRVKVTIKPNNGGMVSDETLAAEREFRRFAQDWLAHDEAAKLSGLRNQVWGLIADLFFYNLLNHPDCGKEYLEACRFAFGQGDIQPDLFYRAAEALERPRSRNLAGELEVVDGALKLILEKPDAYPKIQGSYANRGEVIKDLQQKRDHLVAELAGSNPNAPTASPWIQSVCLLDLATPVNGYAWLFKPVVQDGQVYAVALGFQQWGLPEDSLQLVRVPLAGGPPSFLGRAKFAMLGLDLDEFNNHFKYHLAHRLSREPSVMAAAYPFVRAACVGAGCYFAATSSGVFIFPTNGGPVLQLNTTNGLPSDDVHAVAFLDGKLYIGSGEINRAGYIAAYDPDTRKVAILASSRRSEQISPFDDQPPFCTMGFAADPVRHRLLMAVSSDIIPNGKIPDITPSMGIWNYLPATGEYKQLAPLLLPTRGAVWLQYDAWFGPADANTVAVKELFLMALFDLRNDRLLSVCGPKTARTNAAYALWRRPVPDVPGSTTLVNGPFFIRDGWFYSARPFERLSLADGRRETLSPLRTDYPFEPKESLQLLDDGKHVLAADEISLWRLELNPDQPHAPVGDGPNNRKGVTDD
jgi:hypothetical protein